MIILFNPTLFKLPVYSHILTAKSLRMGLIEQSWLPPKQTRNLLKETATYQLRATGTKQRTLSTHL